MQASTTHRWSRETAAEVVLVAGNATFTTVESTNTITDPRMQATRAGSAKIERLSPETRNRLVLVACILGSVIVFVDSTVVNVALPAIQDDLGGGLALQQWVVDAYLLTARLAAPRRRLAR